MNENCNPFCISHYEVLAGKKIPNGMSMKGDSLLKKFGTFAMLNPRPPLPKEVLESQIIISAT